VTRILLTVVVPLLLPLAVYAVWLVLSHRRAAEEAEGRRTWLTTTPWTPLLAAGVVLMAVTLVATSFLLGDPPGDYRPAQVIDGQVVPGEVTPKPTR